MRMRLVLLLSLCLAAIGQSALAQPAAPPAPLEGPPPSVRVFLDCRAYCDGSFIRTELPFVDHVTERESADVHVLVTTRGTGGGGIEYTISFIGLGAFERIQDTGRMVTRPGDSDDQIRHNLVRALKVGLVRYVALTPLRDAIDVNIRMPKAGQRPQVRKPADPWKSWVFRLRGNMDTSGEESSTTLRLWGNASATRVTEAWKSAFNLNVNYKRYRYSFDDGNPDYISYSRDSNAGVLLVRTVGEHWGAGARASTSSSTYTNQRRTYRVAPAVEYNVFPYAETTRRQLTFRYSLGAYHFAYYERTIYDKLEEMAAGHSLAVNLDTRQPWGTMNLQAEASQYLPETQKNRVSLEGYVDVRLFKGFSLNLGADTSMIRDQIYLSAEEATDEDILLRQRQIATSYDYRFTIGFTYSFGSVYNNVVNSRLSGF